MADFVEYRCHHFNLSDLNYNPRNGLYVGNNNESHIKRHIFLQPLTLIFLAFNHANQG